MKIILMMLCLFLTNFTCLHAIPMGGEYERVEGEVVDWIYREGITLKRSTPGFSVEYEIPAHYVFLLKSDNMKEDDVNWLNGLSRRFLFQDPIFHRIGNKNEFIVVVFAKKDIVSLENESTSIRIDNYKISVSGFGYFDATFSKLAENP